MFFLWKNLGRDVISNKSTKDLQLNELNKNGEMRVTGKWACALRVSSYPRMCRSWLSAAVIELGSQYCLRNNQRSVPLGHAADIIKIKGVARGMAQWARAPSIEMPPMTKIWQKSLVSLFSVSFSIFAYNSTRVQQ